MRRWELGVSRGLGLNGFRVKAYSVSVRGLGLIRFGNRNLTLRVVAPSQLRAYRA